VSEKQELENLRELDPETITEVHNHYFPEIYRYARYRLGDSSAAEDVAGEVFVRLLEALHSGRGPSKSLRGWIFGTASNLVNDTFRRVYKHEIEELSSAARIGASIRQRTLGAGDGENHGKETQCDQGIAVSGFEHVEAPHGSRQLMSERLFDKLQDCLTAMEQGAELNEVLARYPDLEADLRPVLEAAENARETASFSVPSEAAHRSRTRLLGHAAKLREKHPPQRWFGLPRVATVALTAAFVVLISAGGLLTASAQALPGDALYSMKRAVEKVSLTLASGEKAKRSMQAEYNQRRIDETVVLLKLGRSEKVTFEGVLNEKTDNFWMVDDVRTLVMPNTRIMGQIEVGMGIEVTGDVQPGDWVEAITITLRTYQLYGTLQQSQDDRWLVDGMSFIVDDLTLIDDGIEVGDDVVALLRVDDNGEATALAILEADDEPSSQGEDSPSETDSETETQQPPTEEDESETPESTQESDEPEDTGTPEPDETDEPDDTSEPDEKDEHDDTPKPDETDESDETDEPDDTPDPEGTPEPTNTPDD